MPETHHAPSGNALASAIKRSGRHLLPFLLLMYVVAFVDRVNIGYVKGALARDVGLNDAAFGFGASIFFIGYALFEVPNNLILHRVGARIWMCRIMVTWGLISATTMFVTSAHWFYFVRFLLGVAEAGFFPGVVLYMTYWFPSRDRGAMMGWFYFGAPLAQILGGPISGALIELNDHAGLHGWQWMFLIEGLSAMAVGIWALLYLTDRPADAAWLSAEERVALNTELSAEIKGKRGHSAAGDTLSALRSPRVLAFGFIYGLIQMSVYGVTFYLPSQVGHLLQRETGLIVGLVSAIPWLCALWAAYALPRRVGPWGPAHHVAAGALLAAALGIAVSAVGSPLIAILALCLATAGFIGAQPLFWTIPANELTGTGAAGGLALINSIGALGGFLAPNVKTLAESALPFSGAGQYILAAAAFAGAVTLYQLRVRSPLELESPSAPV